MQSFWSPTAFPRVKNFGWITSLTVIKPINAFHPLNPINPPGFWMVLGDLGSWSSGGLRGFKEIKPLNGVNNWIFSLLLIHQKVDEDRNNYIFDACNHPKGPWRTKRGWMGLKGLTFQSFGTPRVAGIQRNPAPCYQPWNFLVLILDPGPSGGFMVLMGVDIWQHWHIKSINPPQGPGFEDPRIPGSHVLAISHRIKTIEPRIPQSPGWILMFLLLLLQFFWLWSWGSKASWYLCSSEITGRGEQQRHADEFPQDFLGDAVTRDLGKDVVFSAVKRAVTWRKCRQVVGVFCSLSGCWTLPWLGQVGVDSLSLDPSNAYQIWKQIMDAVGLCWIFSSDVLADFAHKVLQAGGMSRNLRAKCDEFSRYRHQYQSCSAS